MDKKQLGILGEEVVASEYIKQGYKIVIKNYKSRVGELDIVALKNGCIAVIEVKTRANNNFANAKDYVTLAKQRKIKATTLLFLQKENMLDYIVRFDVAEVYIKNNNKPIINIIYQAFD